MDILDILRQMERNDGYFARAAVTEALARRDEIVPELLRILEAVADDPQRYAKEPDYMALTYAMFLLAQFRETRACPLLVRIFSAPDETAFDLVGETVTEDLCNILASVWAPPGVILPVSSCRSAACGRCAKVRCAKSTSTNASAVEIILPDGRNLNQETVRAGMAWWYQQYARRETVLRDLEQEARASKRGLWIDPKPVAPWEWRKAGRK